MLTVTFLIYSIHQYVLHAIDICLFIFHIPFFQVFFVTNLNWGCNIVKCCTFFISKSMYCTRIFHFYFFFFSVFWQLLYIFIRPYLTRYCLSTSTIKYSFAQWSPYQTMLSFICKTTYKNHNFLYRNSCRPQNTSVKNTTGKKPMQSLSSFFFCMEQYQVFLVILFYSFSESACAWFYCIIESGSCKKGKSTVFFT